MDLEIHIGDRERSSLERTGAAVLRDVIDPDQLGACRAAARAIFSLTFEERIRYASPAPLQAGYEQYGRSVAQDTGLANLMHAWNVFPTDVNRIPDTHNASFLLPAFARDLHQLAETILKLLLADGKAESIIDPYGSGLQVIEYINDTVTAGDNRRHQSVHEDASLLTLLPQATRPGLVLLHNGERRSVHISESSVLVLAGKALKRLTGGRIHSALHTVERMNHLSEPGRLAFPYFLNPSRDVNLSAEKGRKENAGEMIDKYREAIFRQ